MGTRGWVILGPTTDGPKPEPAEPWRHDPEMRVLNPYLRTPDGGFPLETMNLFPEITLLANDSPIGSTTFFIRPVRRGEIDFAVVRRWLALCGTHHDRSCRKNPAVEALRRTNPANEISDFRCIDVEQNCLVRPPKACRYAALSYVWGRIGFFTTLQENVAMLEEPGALGRPAYHDRIPLTIRDAMQVVREIGIRYLWVDSLCIVQDEPNQNKLTHIQSMDLVYSAADLVIVAAGSRDACSPTTPTSTTPSQAWPAS